MAMKFDSLHDVFIEELQDMMSAEQQLSKALPKMAEAATAPELKDKLQNHLRQTQGQIERLEKVFTMLGLAPKAEQCEGMAGIIRDGEKVLKAQGSPTAKDAALIAAAQKAEHYEIASYGTAHTFAITLGRDDVAEQLQTTLRQEYQADNMLTELAQRSVNKKAA